LPAQRGRFLALCGIADAAIHQLDVGHRRIVAGAETAAQDTQVSARTRLVARSQLVEQLLHGIAIAQAIECETTVVHRIVLRARDQRLGEAAQFLGLGQRGLDQLMLEQGQGNGLHRRLAMGAGTAERAA
jgi:hypothetical protein